MINKTIVGLLIILMLLGASLGYYSYTLNQQLNSLRAEAAASQTGQDAEIKAVGDGLAVVSAETRSSLNALQGEINKSQAALDTFTGKLAETLARVDTMGGEVDGAVAKVGTLEKEIGNTAVELSQSTMNASEVYQKVSQATVRISNGNTTIGSGFLFDDDGHVVTANHVIENLFRIYVVLPDGSFSAATLVGSSSPSDVAVLKLDEKPAVAPAVLADSASVRVGEPVAVIGSPFNLRETLTSGIVSHLNRFTEINSSNFQTRRVANLIQFDAAVNFGNSGCPLMNREGEIIGLVIARVDPGEGDGIYYAVSSNKVKKVAAAILSRGSFDYPWIGVSISDITPQMAEDRGLTTTSGALVMGVLTASPAEAANIRIDDVIQSIDGNPVGDVSDLMSYLGEYKIPGDNAEITLLRGTNVLQLSVTVGRLP